MRLRILFVASFFVAASAVQAQPFTATFPITTSAKDSLSLEQYLDLVLAANPTAISAALETDIAEATVRDAYGAFDPIFRGLGRTQNQKWFSHCRPSQCQF
ncbi:MAG: hypothetical protein RML35_04685 [Chloroherpetonaceae bacterium]|nr:hypothetical protein [Chloroherpetonaceae bacterium]